MVFHRATRLVTSSRFTRNEIISRGGTTDQCCIIAPSIDLPPPLQARECRRREFRERLGLKDELVVLTVARLEDRKGHDVVLRALALVAKEFDSVHYVVVGAGDTTRLRRLASDLELD